MKLITIEGDVFRADRIDVITHKKNEIRVYTNGVGTSHYGYTYDNLEMALSAHLRAVMDWKKALE